MLLLAGTQQRPVLEELVGLQIQKRPIGAANSIYTDASFINCFQFNKSVVFLNKGAEVVNYFLVAEASIHDANTLDELYMHILRMSVDEMIFVIDVYEKFNNNNNYKFYYCKYLLADDVQLVIPGLRKFLIDDILNQL